MAQIYGSGIGNYANTAQVNDLGQLHVVVPGSVNTYGTVSISGNIIIGSVSASVDSIYIQSGNQVEVYSSGLTQVYHSGLLQTYSSGLTNISGVVNQGTSPWLVTGSIYSTGSIRVSNLYEGSNTWVNGGSIQIFGSVVNQSGTSFINVTQTTSPWAVSGTSTIAGSIYSTGSINIISPQTVGSYAGVGSIIGSVFQGTTPWVFSGTSTVAGSVYVTGSINITNQYQGSSIFGMGSFYNILTTPTLVSNNSYYKFEYIISGTSTGITGSRIGSIIQFIGAGSYVQILTYSNDLLITTGSFS